MGTVKETRVYVNVVNKHRAHGYHGTSSTPYINSDDSKSDLEDVRQQSRPRQEKTS